ncbi:TetR family transcriptional regulator [Alcanivorax sp. MD8A]|uniref:TetR/AcrR family transcriptional regulator n=1 Tax=Alcanivorax sp. MD8A TaxID=1177157 RepID=UPI000C9C1545|nr:TetR/AcrR family transcriptional regulator [Alcanivorax sp. MD8A]MEE2870385.1 TetR/AcrR family transcriptional regulator [Pseudomonadota bacterium]PNE02480.1 TetR family transcriptional regulator [Alcanivorax sp. MD8A]
MADQSEALACEPRNAILDAAALCFMERGFNATSIDDIARRLSATKGMVYHYFGSKAELFFEIHHRAMDALFAEVEPVAEQSLPAPQRFTEMARRYVRTLIETQPYQRAVSEAVQMVLRNSTTEDQRSQLTRLQERRNRCEALFMTVLEEGMAEGTMCALRPRVSIKPVFGAMNSVINWYHHRDGETEEEIQALVDEVVGVALRGIIKGS